MKTLETARYRIAGESEWQYGFVGDDGEILYDLEGRVVTAKNLDWERSTLEAPEGKEFRMSSIDGSFKLELVPLATRTLASTSYMGVFGGQSSAAALGSLDDSRTISNFKLNISSLEQHDPATWECFTCSTVGRGTEIPDVCPRCGISHRKVPFHEAIGLPTAMSIWLAEGLEIFNARHREIKAVLLSKSVDGSATYIPGYATIEIVREIVGPTYEDYVERQVFYPTGSKDGDTSNTVLIDALVSCKVGDNKLHFEYTEGGKGFITFIF